ncbi:hypothetical protein M3J09_004713 [Ascochyta lentis]
MASKRSSSFLDEADRVLGERKRSRNKVACYPCNKRKVKCDAKQPCTTCIKRGHPTICVYPGNRTEEVTSACATAPNEQRQSTIEREMTIDPPFLDTDSTTTYMQRLAREKGSEVADDVSPALALGSTLTWNPFQRYNGRGCVHSELIDILPDSNSLQRHYRSYRYIVHPLSPLIDIEHLELKIADYLEGNTTVTPGATSAATLALILAVLACGAQYSDLDLSGRRSTSRDYASRSLRALELANYLIRPTAPCLQTLLLLGTFIRNDGDANASWALLGTTIRLAQSVGLHDAENMSNLSAVDKRMRSQLWKAALQHDSILTLFFDRPASTFSLTIFDLHSAALAESLDFSQVMWGITQLCAGRLMQRTQGVDLDRSLQSLRHVDNLLTLSAPHLQRRTACLSMQDRLQHYAINLHMSFLTSVICRPIFLLPERGSGASYIELNKRGRDALADTVRHFLNLHKLTTYAIRTWTTMHEALSSSLLLEVLNEPVILSR